MPEKRNGLWWVIWGISSIALAAVLGTKMFAEGYDSRLFLPGNTSHGHYQIEMECAVCHTGAFSDRDAMQAACMHCHADELKRADDSHPKSKFTDPRNSGLIEILDARYCVSCHIEHRPGITQSMGLTVPGDVCFHCHRDIGDDRPTHRDLGFESCTDAGCHNFHDNRALYEDFLLKHAEQPALIADARPPARNFASYLAANPGHPYPFDEYPLRPLGAALADAPAGKTAVPGVLDEWLASAHARSGVNCSACHRADGAEWSDRVNLRTCQDCHADETTGFFAGRHGMRLGRGLTPMSPAQARLPMKPEARRLELDCSSCHGVHGFDTTYAAVEACLGCHDDRHSRSFKDSAHYTLWKSGAETGVSCAGCHLPRVGHPAEAGRVLVQHNQNDMLRPNEKMLRSVCLECHGLGFAIDALADRALIESNFSGTPSVHVRSIEMARENLLRDTERRQ